MKIEIEIEKTEEMKFDCVVCGGGLSGIAAAITTARSGLKTAIIEQSGVFGGVAVSCGINHLLGGRYYNETTKVMERKVGGLFDFLSDNLISEGHAIDPDSIDISNNPHGWYPRMAAGIPFDGNAMKVALDTLILDEYITPFLQTRIIGVLRDGDQISSLIVNNKSGNMLIHGTNIIDGTGDADVAALAGCTHEKGRESDGLMTPVSLEFHVDRVDKEELLAYQNEHTSPKLVEIIEDLKQKNIWDFPFDIFVTVQLHESDIFLVNTLRQTQVDGTRGKDLTYALIQGRKDVYKLHEIMKQYFPGFSNSRIRFIADSLGVRETRRIRGIAHVSLEDALQGKTYLDSIARTTYNFDLPDPERPSFDPMMGSCKNPTAKRRYTAIEVPYGVMVPDTVVNLLAIGRAVSVDREVLGALRVMGPCMMLGEAAGTAVAYACEQHISIPEIDGKIIHQRMISQGCLLGDD